MNADGLFIKNVMYRVSVGYVCLHYTFCSRTKVIWLFLSKLNEFILMCRQITLKTDDIDLAGDRSGPVAGILSGNRGPISRSRLPWIL